MSTDRPSSQLNELDGLLSLAERLQTEMASLRWRMQLALVVGWVGLLLSGAVAALVAELLSSPDVFDPVAQLVFPLLVVGVGSVSPLVGMRLHTGLRRRYIADRYAAAEVMNLLHETAAIAQLSSHWSRVREAEFRIRLSRLDLVSDEYRGGMQEDEPGVERTLAYMTRPHSDIDHRALAGLLVDSGFHPSVLGGTSSQARLLWRHGDYGDNLRIVQSQTVVELSLVGIDGVRRSARANDTDSALRAVKNALREIDSLGPRRRRDSTRDD